MIKAIRRGLTDAVRRAARFGRVRRAEGSLREELGRLSPGELDRSLADAGLNRGDMEVIMRSGGARRRLMARMMRQFEADPKAIPPRYWGAMREAERVCAHCKSAKRCRSWLDQGRRNAAARVFCPNAELFESMARDARLDP